MTNEEMLREFETGRPVNFRGAPFKIVGIEFFRCSPGDEKLVFFLVNAMNSEWMLGPPLEASSDECERVRALFAA